MGRINKNKKQEIQEIENKLKEGSKIENKFDIIILLFFKIWIIIIQSKNWKMIKRNRIEDKYA